MIVIIDHFRRCDAHIIVIIIIFDVDASQRQRSIIVLHRIRRSLWTQSKNDRGLIHHYLSVTVYVIHQATGGDNGEEMDEGLVRYLRCDDDDELNHEGVQTPNERLEPMESLDSGTGEENVEGVVSVHPYRRAAVHRDETEDEDAVQRADDADGAGDEEHGAHEKFQVLAVVEQVKHIPADGLVRIEDGHHRAGGDGRNDSINFQTIEAVSLPFQHLGVVYVWRLFFAVGGFETIGIVIFEGKRSVIFAVVFRNGRFSPLGRRRHRRRGITCIVLYFRQDLQRLLLHPALHRPKLVQLGAPPLDGQAEPLHRLDGLPQLLQQQRVLVVFVGCDCCLCSVIIIVFAPAGARLC